MDRRRLVARDIPRAGGSVALAALLALAAGCGSSTKQSPTTTTSSEPTTTTTSSAPPTTTAITTAPIYPSWTPLPRAPIAGRIAAGVVWTGTEVLVWGGVSGGMSGRAAVGDGAAYNPATRAWRTIAAAPSGVLGDVGSGAVWTGEQAVFWAGNSPGGPAGGAVYDPKADTWKRLPRGPLGAREGYASAWTGKEMLIIGGASGDMIASPAAAAVDPTTGSWRRLRAFDAIRGLQGPTTVWTGRQLLLIGTRSLCPELGSACRHSEPFFSSYDPATDTLHAIDLTKAPIGARRGELRPIAWTGTDALFDDQANPAAGVLSYDPATNAWQNGRRPPCAVPDPYYTQTAWIGNRYVEACGSDGLQIYSPATDTWSLRRPGASPLNSRSGSAIVWTGTDLFAWSGTPKQPGNPTPDDGATLRLGS